MIHYMKREVKRDILMSHINRRNVNHRKISLKDFSPELLAPPLTVGSLSGVQGPMASPFYAPVPHSLENFNY